MGDYGTMPGKSIGKIAASECSLRFNCCLNGRVIISCQMIECLLIHLWSFSPLLFTWLHTQGSVQCSINTDQQHGNTLRRLLDVMNYTGVIFYCSILTA